MLTTRQKIAYNATFSIIARLIDGALAIIVTAYLARYLGPAGFGNYVVVFTYWYIFIVLADLGLYQIAVREISQNKEKENEIISNAFTLRLSATALVFFIGIILFLFLPYSYEVKLGLICGAIGFWALSSSQVLAGVFQKNLRIDKISIAEVITRVVNFLLTLYVIKKDLGFIYVIGALSVSSIVNLAITCYFANKFVRLRLAFDKAVWKKMIREGWPLAAAAIFVMVYFRLNAIILSLVSGEEAVGIFGIGYKILENLIYFPAMFVGLVMPILSLTAKTDMARFKDVMQKAFNALVICLLPMVSFTLLLSDKIVYLIGGKNFPQSAGVLDVLIFAVAAIFLATLWSNAIIALGAQKYLAKIYFIGAVISVIINIPLIYSFSYVGAAWGTFITEFIVTAMMAVHLHRLIGYVVVFERAFKVMLATFIGSAVILLIGKKIIFSSLIVALGVQLTLGCIFYCLVLFLVKGVSMEEIGIFLRKKEAK